MLQVRAISRPRLGNIKLDALGQRVQLHWYLYPVVVFVLLRLATLAWASLTAIWQPIPAGSYLNLYYDIPPLTSGLDGLLWGPWQRWDTLWYLKIATAGYSGTDLSTAFFPLYPFLIRLAMPLFGNNSTAAAVLLSSIGALATFLLLYRYTADELDDAAARRTLILFAAFPTAFFLFAGYTESLFLSLALGSLLAARAGRWSAASLLGAFAALARPQGALFIVVLTLEFLLQYREYRVSLIRSAWLGVTAVGALAYPVYLARAFGDPLLWMHVQSWWHKSVMPWDALRDSVAVVLGAQDASELYYAIRDPLAAFLFLALLVWSVFRLRPTLTLYIAIVILPPLFSEAIYQPLLPIASMWRYVLVAFPGFMLLAQIPFLARWYKPIALASLLLQFFVLFRFTHWVFVG